MSTLKDLNERYRQALEAKQDYEAAISNLKLCATDVRSSVCEAYTARLNLYHPDLVAEMMGCYHNGEQIKDAMQKGKRWPERNDPTLTTYAAVLSAVPLDQRSEEMRQCLDYWQRFDEIKAEIEKLYPAPHPFYWNGPRLAGPNLYKDFGIVEVSR